MGEYNYFEDPNGGISNDFLFEMANLFQSDTGLPMIVWADVNRLGKHNEPRIKVSTSHAAHVSDGELIPVLLSEHPKILEKTKKDALSPNDLKLVGQFIALNKDILMQYWNGEISSKAFTNAILKLK